MPLFREFLQPSSEPPVRVPVQTPTHSENAVARSTLPTQQPITGQPGAIENIRIPDNQSCPPGLKSLNEIDQLLVHQGTEVLEAVTGFESANKYTIKNSKGETIYWAAEKSDCCERQMCGQNRSFTMNIYNNHNQEVIHLYRDLACGGCCCITENMQVSAPTGNVIGSVEQELTIMTPKFYIKNETGEIVLTIKGEAIPVSFGGNVEFRVYSRDGQTEVGKITKQWGGLMREVATKSDNFGLTFPLDLNVKSKAVLLGTCFLIDFVYFENR